jgi:hypothetical protein
MPQSLYLRETALVALGSPQSQSGQSSEVAKSLLLLKNETHLFSPEI